MSPTDPATPNALELIRARARDFQVFGELGRAGDEDIWFLARRTGESTLVALRLYRRTVDEWGDPVFDYAVVKEVGSGVSVGSASCRACGAQLRSFARYCGLCGADQTLGQRTGHSQEERAARMAEVRSAAEAHYDVLGEMPRAEGGGVVYFALEKAGGALVQLRLREADGELELGETRVSVRLDATVTALPVTPSPAPNRARPTPLGMTDPAARRPSPGNLPPPEPPPAPAAPADAAPGGTRKERLLTIAVVVLGLIALLEAWLLLA